MLKSRLRSADVLSWSTEGTIRGGFTICMTDASPSLTRDSLWSASEEAGFTVKKNVSSLVDVLVAADPTSQSGEAREARQLGNRDRPLRVALRSLGEPKDATP